MAGYLYPRQQHIDICGEGEVRIEDVVREAVHASETGGRRVGDRPGADAYRDRSVGPADKGPLVGSRRVKTSDGSALYDYPQGRVTIQVMRKVWREQLS